MQGGGERPGLGSVDGDLDESQRVRVFADAALLAAGGNVDPCDPLLVRLAFHRPGALDASRGRDQALGDAAALAEVVVVGPGAITLNVGAGGLRCATVELHAAVHPNHPDQASVNYRRQPHIRRSKAIPGLNPYGPC